MGKNFVRFLALALCALFCLLSPAAFAEEKTGNYYYSSGQWEGELAGSYWGEGESRLALKKGTIDFFYGGSFEGPISYGHPEGYGTYTFYNGSTKTGTFSWTYDLRMVMEASLSGSGPHYSGADLSYTGMTLDGEPWGYGELDFQDGGTFYGEFRNGTVQGCGTYVYLEPDPAQDTDVYSRDWAMVSRTPSSLGGRWYSGLTRNGSWDGYGMLCYDHSYYIGEVKNQYCHGHGAYWGWNGTGDPVGSLSRTKCGHYNGGGLSYECWHGSKFSTDEYACQIGSASGGSTGSSGGWTKAPSSSGGRCSVCGGDGWVEKDCSSCSGRGSIRCQSCGGDGKKYCTVCGGDGRMSSDNSRCFTCSGSGYKDCRSCNGQGRQDCSYCRGGKVERRCTACQG